MPNQDNIMILEEKEGNFNSNINGQKNKKICEGEDSQKNKKNEEQFKNLNYMNEYMINHGPDDSKKFIIEEYIGKGSESYVYKIRLKGTNKFFCLKVMKKIKRRINKSELSIAKQIKNNYLSIVLYYYADKNADYDYMIMELGCSNLSNFTRKILKRYTLSETFLCLIAYQVLQGLSYLHMCKIAHLDIKPQNIIITEYLDIKLIDFSVSLDYSQKKGQDIQLNIVGTPYYMSPEVIQEMRIKLKDLQKVDLFSLGVTLYVLGFGRLPFDITPGLDEKENNKELLRKMNSGWKVVNINNTFSEHFVNFLNGLLEIDINKRMNLEQALNSHFIKAAHLILNEKENTYNANSFLSHVITDHIRAYQEFVSNKSGNSNFF